LVEEKIIEDLIVRLYHAADTESSNMQVFQESYENPTHIQEVLRDRFVNSKKAHDLIGREITQMKASDQR
jgi:hypothetical protein